LQRDFPYVKHRGRGNTGITIVEGWKSWRSEISEVSLYSSTSVTVVTVFPVAALARSPSFSFDTGV